MGGGGEGGGGMVEGRREGRTAEIASSVTNLQQPAFYTQHVVLHYFQKGHVQYNIFLFSSRSR